MKFTKQFFLTSAACLVGAVAAQAADLPSKKAAPAEYVKTCTAHGVGFFYIPGTDTCIRLGGFVMAWYTFNNVQNAGVYSQTYQTLAHPGTFTKNGVTFTSPWGQGPTASAQSGNASGFHQRDRMTFDARSTTAYGTLRSYISVQYDLNAGADPNYYGNPGAPNIDKGFIQWAGLTAGFTQSFFDFYSDNVSLGPDLRTSDSSDTALAYTAVFSNGFTTTLSLEDRNTQTLGSGNGTFGTKLAPSSVSGQPIYGGTYQGTRLPDIVGQANLDQSWGQAQLSALYHNQNAIDQNAGRYDGTGKTSSGWGINGGVQVKLPMLGPGDDIWLQGTYMKGDLGILMQGAPRSWYGNGIIIPDYDSVFGANGQVKLPTSWAVLTAFEHNWTPQYQTSLLAGYIGVKYPSAVTSWDALTSMNDFTGTSAPVTTNWNELTLGMINTWTPVDKFTIALETLYRRLDQKSPYSGYLGEGGVAFKRNISSGQAQLRVERDF
jgi:hypothetical protein